MSLRTPEMEAEYQQAKANGTLVSIVDEVPIREWEYWKLVVNRFWHDEVCVFGLMIVLKRECPIIWQIRDDELRELWRTVCPWMDAKFHSLTINLEAMRSINNIPHIQVYILQKKFQ
ncbi:MAG: hypothetical protein V4440_04445 [Pseudomonadota bacterium]